MDNILSHLFFSTRRNTAKELRYFNMLLSFKIVFLCCFCCVLEKEVNSAHFEAFDRWNS